MAESNAIYCNACGRTINLDSGADREEALFVKKDWGYFSEKDLQTHEFVLCEQCYDKMTEKFSLDVIVSDKREIL